MLTQLLESAPRRRRRHYSILASIVGHAAALSGAVVAAHPLPEPDEPERVIILRPPSPPPPPPPSCKRCVSRPSKTATGARGTPLPIFPHEPLAGFTVDVPSELREANETVVISGDEWTRETTSDHRGPATVGGERATVDREVAPHPGNPAPRYPLELRSARIEGRVDARFVVDTTGRVIMTSVDVNASTHLAFGRAVVDALRHARFTPAEFRGRKVSQLVSQPFVFLLREGS